MSTVSRRQFLCGVGSFGALGVLPTFCFGSAVDVPTNLHKKVEAQVCMGTFVSITAYNKSKDLLEEALENTFEAARSNERVFTRHSASSPLGVLNTQGKLKNAPEGIQYLLRQSMQLAKITDNAFTPASAPVLNLLSEYNVRAITELPKSVQKDAVRLLDSRNISMDGRTISLGSSDAGVSLDGIAKGYIVDLLAVTLTQQGVTNFLINAGGDIRVGTSLMPDQTWTVGIQNASNPVSNLQTLTVAEGAVATSGNYESLSSKGYEHIVSGKKGNSLSNDARCLAVTATAPTCAEADAMATSLFAMGMEQGTAFLRKHPRYRCVWQMDSGVLIES
ncbi:MAG: FAD:protein FMN transferase [Desulfovibrionales bacterium]|nr:FAD:protein FMN transferase [Desulfovibrionales bacterium]